MGNPVDLAAVVARVEEVYARQCKRVRNRREGEYGEYTNADWQDVMRMKMACDALLAAPAVPSEAMVEAWEGE